jgi:hypothetical protein
MVLPFDRQWAVVPPDPSRERLLAERAVPYLKGQGLDDQAVIQCLVEEFEIDLETAEAVAYYAAWGGA